MSCDALYLTSSWPAQAYISNGHITQIYLYLTNYFDVLNVTDSQLKFDCSAILMTSPIWNPSTDCDWFLFCLDVKITTPVFDSLCERKLDDIYSCISQTYHSITEIESLLSQVIYNWVSSANITVWQPCFLMTSSSESEGNYHHCKSLQIHRSIKLDDLVYMAHTESKWKVFWNTD